MPAQAPYKFVDRRGTSYGSSNQLVPAATPNTDRGTTPTLDLDFHRNVSAYGRITLMNSGRRLYAGNSVVKAAINEAATCAVATYQAQFVGAQPDQDTKKPDFGKLAEEFLATDDKYCDIRGAPFTMGIFRRNLIIAIIRDGDLGIILTEDSLQNGRIQVIPSHRIGNGRGMPSSMNVQGGPYDGARIIDGVVVNDYGAPMAYRVLGESGRNDDYQDISAFNMILAFLPEYADQLRGLSSLGAGAFIWQDVAETDYHERLAQKAASRIHLIENNATGDVDPAKVPIIMDSSETNPQPLGLAPDENGNSTGLIQENYDHGGTRYYRARSGEGIQAFSINRPGGDSQKFAERQQRYALAGMGWSYDYTVDIANIGGVGVRIVIDKLNRTVSVLQEHVVVPVSRRIDGYRISKRIKNGLLPKDPEWWRWEYQGPAELTGDAKYDSDIDLQENRAGFKPMRDITGKRGTGYWEDVQDQLIKEEKRLQKRCKEEGVDPGRIRLLTPNGNPPPTSAEPKEKPENTDQNTENENE